MCSEQAQGIILTGKQCNKLKLIIRKNGSSQSLAERAKVIGIKAPVRELKCSHSMARLWRRRWISQAEKLSVCECLKDTPCPSHPPKFTAEKVCKRMAFDVGSLYDRGV